MINLPFQLDLIRNGILARKCILVTIIIQIRWIGLGNRFERCIGSRRLVF